MQYDFKIAQEVGWAVLIGVAVFAATTLMAFDPATVTDWQTWAVALGGGLARTVGAAVLTVLRPGS